MSLNNIVAKSYCTIIVHKVQTLAKLAPPCQGYSDGEGVTRTSTCDVFSSFQEFTSKKTIVIKEKVKLIKTNQQTNQEFL